MDGLFLEKNNKNFNYNHKMINLIYIKIKKNGNNCLYKKKIIILN